MIETLQQILADLLAFSESIIVPDWAQLVGLLSVFLLLFVVGPLLTVLLLFWVRYAIVKPRPKVAYADPRRAAPLDATGNPVFPVGEPYSPREGVIYEPGMTRSPSGETLVVACPKCSLVRPATDDTCGNCGLSFTLTPTTRSFRPAGPPPGGRAAA
ncbi:MAG: hypothetical protein QG587_1327 [Chloroflexota bacterium]|nr:hypothetical protein [Chloroflexota bacterium]